MKTIRFFPIIIAFLAFSFLVSCSDDEPTIPKIDDKNYLPTNNGAFWISEVYTLDTNGRINNEPYFDSLIVTGNEMKLGKNASVFKAYTSVNRSDWTENRTEYYYIDGNKIYAHSDFFQSVFGVNISELGVDLPIPYPDEWYLFIDPTSSTWVIDTITVEGVEAEFLGNKYVLDGKIIINGMRDNSETVTYKSQNYTAQNFSVAFKLTGTINNIPFVLNRLLRISMIEDIGFYKMKNEAFSIPIIGFPVPGFERILIENYDGK